MPPEPEPTWWDAALPWLLDNSVALIAALISVGALWVAILARRDRAFRPVWGKHITHEDGNAWLHFVNETRDTAENVRILLNGEVHAHRARVEIHESITALAPPVGDVAVMWCRVGETTDRRFPPRPSRERLTRALAAWRG